MLSRLSILFIDQGSGFWQLSERLWSWEQTTHQHQDPSVQQLHSRELMQQRRRRLRRRHLKSEFTLPQSLSRLFHLVQCVECCNFFLELNPSRLSRSAGNENKVVVLCSSPPQNMKLGIFTSKSCSDGKEMYKKAWCTCKVVVLSI